MSTLLSVPIINNSNNPLPNYATHGAAGMDIRAFLAEPMILPPLERGLVPTGLHVALPQGYEMQLRMRSGWALKGLIMPNAPATIDADYRGEIRILVANISNETLTIQPGERMAQMVIAKHETVVWQPTTQLSETTRGEGGFGSTGKE
ncbi:MAG: dUTP diphosphatase [Sphingobacteriales bacterium]|jgi:dUTP pyrophosphatase|nr:dUTP diphosphatase [Sphingobacteriales bacterium]MBP9142562.1 dUTP diphosphatase [Chitinophagales bacterium]MDA0199541.1 dUTP diphosphatase [Bacteroidota bacterium]MBK6890491.1 dUTP diphosphatase [Sphingobacteriales bacterium]MBK7526458.1 dUTP diphosphatase [Sphingobacteriales bacterium]